MNKSYGQLYDEFTKEKSHEDLAKAHINLLRKRQGELGELDILLGKEIIEIERALSKPNVNIENEKKIIKQRLTDIKKTIKIGEI